MPASRSAQIAFLYTAGPTQNDNHERLPRYFTAAGWQVCIDAHNAVGMRRGEVFIGREPAQNFDLIWPLGFGPQVGFLDRCELLRHLPQDRLVTPVDAWLSLHGKSVFPEFSPPSVVSAQLPALLDALADFGGRAVLKPLAGSYGRDVVLVEAPEQLEAAVAVGTDRVWMLQAYIEAISAGEIRTLVCGEAVLGSYLRRPRDGFHANLARDAEALPTELTGAAAQRVAEIHQHLLAQGVGFAAIDTVDEYLMEVNVANPGGLATLEALYDRDLGPALCRAIDAHRSR